MTWGVLIAVFLSGLRHGVDLDHLAAISDISSSQIDKRRSMLLATMYASGHALVLVVLGLAAVVVGEKIPAALDSFMGRVIGATLIVLGLYVIYSLVRYGRGARLRSRWMVVLTGVHRALRRIRPTPQVPVEIDHEHPHSHGAGHQHGHRVGQPAENVEREAVSVLTKHSHPHRHVVIDSRDPFTDYTGATAFGVGMIHGVGAETPTQMILFATAAGVAGGLSGVVLLVAFVGGLFIANTAVAIAATAGFSTSRRLPAAYFAFAGIAAVVSVYVGTLYLLDLNYP